MRRDFFMVLGVARDASTEQIKQAYREKVRQYHPDLNPDPAAVARFQEVVEAYQVLSDEEARAAYLVQNFPLTRKRQTEADISPVWQYKQELRRRRADYLYIALVCFSLAILGSVAIGWNQQLSLSGDLQEAQCRAVDWVQMSDSDGSRYYDLHYTIQLPWVEQPLFEYRRFESIDEDYREGQAFPCYYNRLTREKPYYLEKYDWQDMARGLPAMFISLAGLLYGAYRLII